MHFRSWPDNLLNWQNDGQGFNHQKDSINPSNYNDTKYRIEDGVLKKGETLF